MVYQPHPCTHRLIERGVNIFMFMDDWISLDITYRAWKEEENEYASYLLVLLINSWSAIWPALILFTCLLVCVMVDQTHPSIHWCTERGVNTCIDHLIDHIMTSNYTPDMLSCYGSVCWVLEPRAQTIHLSSDIVVQWPWYMYGYAIPLLCECYIRCEQCLTGVGNPIHHNMTQAYSAFTLLFGTKISNDTYTSYKS